MFEIGFIIGIYSYLMFALGMFGWLYPQTILLTSIVYILFVILYLIKSKEMRVWNCFKDLLAERDLSIVIGIIAFFAMALVNLLGALGPELGFDALWYHLTFPKLYLLNHAIVHIPGNLLYYSGMPKLVEMLYLPALSLGNEQWAKVMSWVFGILSSAAIYKIGVKVSSPKNSILAVLLFYASFVVGWQSITAYVDLGRTFFEAMTLYGFILFIQTDKKQWFIESACMLGLSIAVKLLSIGSLIIFITLFCIYLKKHYSIIPLYVLLALLIPLPWFLFSYIHTGNPIYPFFTSLYPTGLSNELLHPVKFITDITILFTNLSDRINPLYLLFFLLAPFVYKEFNHKERLVLYYCLLAIIIWYVTPRTGGGRFILPYLPGFSILAGIILGKLDMARTKRLFYALIIGTCVITIVYRLGANMKYVPVLMGMQTKEHFLTTHLNFDYGDFFDTDGYFRNHIQSTDRVLLYGFHNLFYVDFPFTDSSWVREGDMFNYIAVLDSKIPSRFEYWKLVYENPKTHVKLYSGGGEKWVY